MSEFSLLSAMQLPIQIQPAIRPDVQRLCERLNSDAPDPITWLTFIIDCPVVAETIAVAESLQANTQVEELIAEWNGSSYLGPRRQANDGFTRGFVGLVFAPHPSLKKVLFDRCSLTDVNAMYVARAMRGNNNITVLNLRGNRIRLFGARSLAAMLKYNNTLVKLTLQGNNIGRRGAEALASVLPGNVTLKCLNIAGCNIGPFGCRAIAYALRRNGSLDHVDLSSNGVGDRGAARLAGTLRINKTLQFLLLGHNNITSRGCRDLFKAIEQNDTLSEIFLDSNVIGSGVFYIIEVLRRNTTLRVIDLSGRVGIVPGQLALIEQTLRNVNFTLERLYMSIYNLNSSVYSNITRHCRNNERIKKLVNVLRQHDDGSIQAGEWLLILELLCKGRPNPLFQLLRSKPHIYCERATPNQAF